MTQLIRPSLVSRKKASTMEHKEKTLQLELEKFHSKYLSETEVLDRATKHYRERPVDNQDGDKPKTACP